MNVQNLAILRYQLRYKNINWLHICELTLENKSPRTISPLINVHLIILSGLLLPTSYFIATLHFSSLTSLLLIGSYKLLKYFIQIDDDVSENYYEQS